VLCSTYPRIYVHNSNDVNVNDAQDLIAVHIVLPYSNKILFLLYDTATIFNYLTPVCVVSFFCVVCLLDVMCAFVRTSGRGADIRSVPRIPVRHSQAYDRAEGCQRRQEKVILCARTHTTVRMYADIVLTDALSTQGYVRTYEQHAISICFFCCCSTTDNFRR
jgi:hypothetical protein